MTARYLIALGIIATLSFVAFLSLNRVIEAQETSAAIINVSGRQRMLSQRTVHFSHLLVDDDYATDLPDRPGLDDIRKILNYSIGLMEKSHTGLLMGDKEMSLPGDPSEKIRSMYFQEPTDLDKLVTRYIKAVKGLANAPDGELDTDNENFRYIVSVATTKLLDSLDEVVRQYQIESEAEIARLQRIETIVLAITLLTLLIEALFIFRPMVRRVTKDTQELVKAEQQIRTIARTAGEGIIVADADSTIKFVNNELCVIFGYFEEELLEKSLLQLMPEKYRKPHIEGMRRYMTGARPTVLGKRFEIEGLRKDGSVFPIELRIEESVMNDGGGKLFTGSIRDVSERKKNEESLKKLDSAMRQAAEMVVITDDKGSIEYVNPAFEKITGYARDEVIGENSSILQSGKHSSEFYRKMWDTILGGEVWREQLTNKKKSGELYEEDMTISPVLDDDGKVTHFVAIKRDISEQKMLRQQLIQSEKLSSIGTFVSGIAHELNNPLTAILGYSQSLEDNDKLDENTKKDIKIIANQATRSAKIVRNLLKFSREHKQEKRRADINTIVEEMLHLHEYRMKTDNIEIVRDYASDPVPVIADFNQLQQVFVNLLLNAHHEMKETYGKGVMKITTSGSGKEAVVTFENDGPPIPEQHLEKIFDPFFTTKNVGIGTGLGLYISYGIVIEHHGQMRAENIEPRGVRFVITLPIAAKDIPKIPEAKAPVPALSGVKALVVEDEEAIREWLLEILTQNGLFVVAVRDGNEAVALLDRQEFDVVISDVKMPGMSGTELGLWLAEQKPHYADKFIITTGFIDKEIDEYCARMNYHSLMKPYDITQLLDIIDNIVKKTKADPGKNIVEGKPAPRQGREPRPPRAKWRTS